MSIDQENKKLLTIDDLRPLVKLDLIVDGIKGGLMLGNLHKYGGIKVMTQYRDEKLYEIVAEFEGWEYLMCSEATIKHKDYLTKINNELKFSTLNFEKYEISKNIMTLDTRVFPENLMDTNKIILLNHSPHFIINKFSTKKYLNELDDLNRRYSS